MNQDWVATTDEMTGNIKIRDPKSHQELICILPLSVYDFYRAGLGSDVTAYRRQVVLDMNRNASLISAAPRLLELLTFLVGAAETEPEMAIYKAHIEEARALVNRL